MRAHVVVKRAEAAYFADMSLEDEVKLLTNLL
jgi:hypothetical protein